jgi:hypothetical protein
MSDPDKNLESIREPEDLCNWLSNAAPDIWIVLNGKAYITTKEYLVGQELNSDEYKSGPFRFSFRRYEM